MRQHTPGLTLAAIAALMLAACGGSDGSSGGGGTNANVTGRVTFARVLFSTTAQDPDRGLHYAGPEQQPARGVVVRAIDANTQAVLVSGETDNQGNYSLTVPNNTSITIRVVAQMLRGGAAPNWDVRVQDGLLAAPYDYTESGSFNSHSGATHDIAIPTGINSSGTATGARASGPFAILDTIYQGIQTVLGAAPATNFPALIVDWGSQNDGTFFQPGSDQHIALSSSLAGDTDEFDQHVIAHEFGHYLEHNFSRSDSIGGAHALGDKLDARVAFGEGFGYAFAAMVLNDPIARDSSADNGNFFSGSFNLETNPPSNPNGAFSGNYGCWCSETSVWSILWDIFDNAADTNDSLALGFLPIWNVLISDQKVTPAFTTLFSFTTALKAQVPGSASAINTLVAAQNIDAADIDAYGTDETHVPTEVPTIAALPLYGVATPGGSSIVLRSVNDEGRYNKLGNHRFVRFHVPTTQTVTISASSSNPNNPDTDFLVFRAGTLVSAGIDPPTQNPETETFSATEGDYVLDVYDCANGCRSVEGTPGDYNLTVTIN
jgi:hypothetical protein